MKIFEWRLFLPVLSAEEAAALHMPPPAPSSPPPTAAAAPTTPPARAAASDPAMGAATVASSSISPPGAEWVLDARSLIQEYVEAMNELKVAFRSGDIEEARSDEYFAGFAHFGLKYRGLGKLELKVREKRPKRVPGMEAWKKTKLGKNDISAYANELVPLVGALCYATMCDAPQQVTVHKERRKVSLETGLFSLRPEAEGEFCFLRVGVGAGGAPRRSNWISVSVEGSEEGIVKALCTLPAYQVLFRCLDLCLRIMLRSRRAAIEHRFVPVLSGYPAWLQVLSVHSSGPSAALFHEVIHDDCVEILDIIRKQSV